MCGAAAAEVGFPEVTVETSGLQKRLVAFEAAVTTVVVSLAGKKSLSDRDPFEAAVAVVVTASWKAG